MVDLDGEGDAATGAEGADNVEFLRGDAVDNLVSDSVGDLFVKPVVVSEGMQEEFEGFGFDTLGTGNVGDGGRR